MAEVDSEVPFSLLSLEDELTCSICLSPFDCPVTIPCGHNFCQDCLLATWKDSYCCPQCRTHFATKPELKKNTVLSTVVETFNMRTNKSDPGLLSGESRAQDQDRDQEQERAVIRCDTCMEAEASQTCLTCMASYCEDHLRPHRENPNLSFHQLSEPVGDLSERICSDHHKLMDLFCSQHGRPICSFCLQQDHKGCSFMSPEDQRSLKQSDLSSKLDLLDGKITKNKSIISQMIDSENRLKDSSTSRKKVLAAEYQQMRDILVKEEREALKAVDRELESGQTKFKGLTKKFTENIENLTKAKGDIQRQLDQSQTLAFLQASFKLPQAATFEPHAPRISLDSKKVTATQSFAAALKEFLTEILKQPVEDRLPILKPAPAGPGSSGPQPESEITKPPKQKRPPRSHSPGRPPIQPLFRAPAFPPQFPGQHGNFRPPPPLGYYGGPRFMGGPRPRAYGGFTPVSPGTYQEPEPQQIDPGSQAKTGSKKKSQKQKPSQATEVNMGNKTKALSVDDLLDFGVKDKLRACPPESILKPETSDVPPSITSAEKRTELLKYGTILTLDPKTAHKRIALSEELTRASVSDAHSDYPECPERFAVCSQVLSTKGFSRGRHYWEVRLSSSNFVGVGLAYSSIDRKGPSSRLGRNAQSWCVEWFNVKLSAWYNSSETVLVNPSPKRVGVLLDCEEGTATFYNVTDRAYPFHSFVFPFAEAVFPAFWIFSSGSSVSLCKLQA
ncbi:E3 ubiquitin/ISG15 ligase TRIM25-like isoform X2 [Centropristis striata]|uniref:E3 ubiquitin/ISG15 ligase TRIM25-like isoform X2 n=1 Tax=Centropristis striata TaxID=184440 RepID=UPI0027DEB801|nr:E3 ubiquitin/ISG15 ligase TRIM25-like isoform X2 [Centropristis striata]